MTDRHPLLNPIVAHLHSNGRLRVWSLVITIFGDAVLPRGGQISMSDLITITGHADIEPGGLRTAMSRLSKDDWVIGEKEGRNSFYSLTPSGREEFLPATQRIYQPRSAYNNQDWLIAIAPPPNSGLRTKALEKLEPTNPIILQAGVALWLANTAPDRQFLEQMQFLVITPREANLPDWAQDALTPPQLGEAFERLMQMFRPLLENPKTLSEFQPLDALTARILLIHEWRKLVLRYRELPQNLQPDNWPAEKCRAMVGQLYHLLFDRSEQFWTESTDAAQLKTLRARFI